MKNSVIKMDTGEAVRHLVNELSNARQAMVKLQDGETQLRTVLVTITSILFTQEESKIFGGAVPFTRVIERVFHLALLMPKQSILPTEE
jgi:hypothetical protein